jgi:hypothetical protein
MTLEDVGPDNWRHCAALEVEMTLLIHPVVVGQGTRLFPGQRPRTQRSTWSYQDRPKRGNDPGLPAHRAPVVCNRHNADLKPVT